MVRSWSPTSGSSSWKPGPKTYSPALIRKGEGGASMKSSTLPNWSVSTAPQGIRGRASASVARASRSWWKAAMSRRLNLVQMSPLVAYQGSAGRGSALAAYFRPPPRPSGTVSTTVLTASGRSAWSSHSWSTSARCPQEITTSVTPSAASQPSWCPRMGIPVPGISTSGLGRSSVYGRSREPCPPARMTAWVTAGECGCDAVESAVMTAL